MTALVALVKGKNRYQNISQALNLIKNEIIPQVKNKKRVVIKVNLTSPYQELAVTNIDAVKAFLDFLKPHYSRKIKIVEMEARKEGFKNFGFYKLSKKYNVEIDDLSNSQLENFSIFDYHLHKTINIQLYKTILQSDYLVSITPAKTHNEGIVTLGIKNVLVGSIKDPPPIHQGHQAFNKNLYLLAKKIPISLAIIDGTFGMEGDGPVDGDPINSNFVTASINPLAADITATKIMGFNPYKVGYLYYLLRERRKAEIADIKTIGAKISDCQVKFKPHHTYQDQLKWKQAPNLPERFKAKVLSRLSIKQVLAFSNLKEKILKRLNSN